MKHSRANSTCPYRVAVQRSGAAVFLAAVVAVSIGGCRLYHVGAPTLYRQDIRTVHVEMFESESFRRFQAERLTEAVAKQIERDSTLRLASPEATDSFLRGRIVRDIKRVDGENRFDDPRDVEVGWRVEFEWTDRSGRPLTQLSALRIDDAVNFIAEGGQSMATADQQLVERIAQNIVQQMEAPW